MSSDEHIETEYVQVGLRCTALPKTLKHHLITSIYNWCNEEGHTPFIVIDISVKRDEIFPMRQLGHLIENNQLVFNINSTAALNLVISQDIISFNARFGTTQTPVSFSPDSVIGIFSKQTRVGFFFPVIKEEKKEEVQPTQLNVSPAQVPPPRGKPVLTIVK